MNDDMELVDPRDVIEEQDKLITHIIMDVEYHPDYCKLEGITEDEIRAVSNNSRYKIYQESNICRNSLR